MPPQEELLQLPRRLPGPEASLPCIGLWAVRRPALHGPTGLPLELPAGSLHPGGPRVHMVLPSPCRHLCPAPRGVDRSPGASRSRTRLAAGPYSPGPLPSTPLSPTSSALRCFPGLSTQSLPGPQHQPPPGLATQGTGTPAWPGPLMPSHRPRVSFVPRRHTCPLLPPQPVAPLLELLHCPWGSRPSSLHPHHHPGASGRRRRLDLALHGALPPTPAG